MAKKAPKTENKDAVSPDVKKALMEVISAKPEVFNQTFASLDKRLLEIRDIVSWGLTGMMPSAEEGDENTEQTDLSKASLEESKDANKKALEQNKNHYSWVRKSSEFFHGLVKKQTDLQKDQINLY